MNKNICSTEKWKGLNNDLEWVPAKDVFETEMDHIGAECPLQCMMVYKRYTMQYIVFRSLGEFSEHQKYLLDELVQTLPVDWPFEWPCMGWLLINAQRP